MRILHTADWHVGVTLRGRSRTEEHKAVLAEIVELANEEAADLVVVAGDVFHHAAPSAEAEDVAYQALLALAQEQRQLVLVAGNHDSPHRIEALRPLLRLANITACGLPRRADDGGTVRLATRVGEEACVALLPFLSQRGIVKADDLMRGEAAEHTQDYGGRCRQIVEHLCDGFGVETVNLLVAHLTVAGGKQGGGEREAHTILDYYVPPQIFPAHTQYVALGHLHRSQQVAGPGQIWYCGSPLQLDFGEEENQPSVLLVDAVPGEPCSVREAPLVAGRRLRTLRGTREALEGQRDEVGEDYLRIQVEERPTPGLADEIREIFPHAVDVRVVWEAEEGPAEEEWDPGQTTQRPRELFSQYLREAGIEGKELVELFDELLEEAHATDSA